MWVFLIDVLLILIDWLFLFTGFVSLPRFPQRGFRISTPALTHISLDSCLILLVCFTIVACPDLHKALLCYNQIQRFPIVVILLCVCVLLLLPLRTSQRLPVFCRCVHVTQNIRYESLWPRKVTGHNQVIKNPQICTRTSRRPEERLLVELQRRVILTLPCRWVSSKCRKSSPPAAISSFLLVK